MLSAALNSVVSHLLGPIFSNQIVQNIVESSFGYIGKIKAFLMNSIVRVEEVNLELGQKLQSL